MTTPVAIQTPLVRSPVTAIWHPGTNVVNNALRIRIKLSYALPVLPASSHRRFAVAASRSTKEESSSKLEDPDLSFTSQDDLSFLLKLGAGSFAGAAAIKYGSILVPEITRPNIIQALTMISTPVLVAVLVLIKESIVKD